MDARVDLAAGRSKFETRSRRVPLRRTEGACAHRRRGYPLTSARSRDRDAYAPDVVLELPPSLPLHRSSREPDNASCRGHCDFVMEDSGIDSDPKTSTRVEDENVFAGSDSSSCSSNNQPTAQKSTTKQLQKKLEARIEQAKRIQRNSEYTKLPDNEPDNCGASNNSSLIPIQRLPIPQKRKKHNTLIEFWHSDSESEDEMTLFPMARESISKHKQDLTDTFSIEELSEGSEDSLHLGAAPEIHPHTRTYMPTGCFSCNCHVL